MNNHKYKLKYHLTKEVGEFNKEDFKAEDGGTDALIVCSMLYPKDGSYSQNFWSFDGRNEGKELPTGELFKFFMMMGATLAGRADLDPVRKEIAKMPANTFYRLVRLENIRRTAKTNTNAHAAIAEGKEEMK